MSATAPLHRHRHSIGFARQRDARVCWLLDTHPATAAVLVGLGLFPSRNKALKRLRRLVERRRVRLVGTVCRKAAGRPEHVWCRWRPKVDQLLHEVELTELLLRLDVGALLRGPHLADTQVRPDAELRLNGRRYYLELDRGTISYRQVARRFQKYESCPQLSLWICATEERMEGMRQRAGHLRHTALFTTYAEALASPHGEIWRDFRGGKASLPREGGEKAGYNPGQ